MDTYNEELRKLEELLSTKEGYSQFDDTLNKALGYTKAPGGGVYKDPSVPGWGNRVIGFAIDMCSGRHLIGRASFHEWAKIELAHRIEMSCIDSLILDYPSLMYDIADCRAVTVDGWKHSIVLIPNAFQLCAEKIETIELEVKQLRIGLPVSSLILPWMRKA